MKTKLFLIAACALFAGCKNGNGNCDIEELDNRPVSKTYITVYIIPEGFALLPNYFTPETNVFRITFYGEVVSNDRNSALFNSIAERIGDTNWNRPLSNGPPVGTVGKIITSINVVSDTDFDADHPSGIPLNDLISFYGHTPYYFIQNGYKGNEYKIINKKISELGENELVFIVPDPPISFIKLPDVQMNHRITMTITFEDGVVLSTTQDIVFSE